MARPGQAPHARVYGINLTAPVFMPLVVGINGS